MTARSERRRLEQRAIEERAAALGVEYELGEPSLTLEHTREPRRQHWAIMMMIFGWLAFLGAAVSLTPSAGATLSERVIFTAVTMGLVGGGIALYRSAPPPRTDRIFGFTGGVAQQLATEAGPRVIPWALLDHAITRFVEPEDGDPYLGTVILTGLDGTRVAAGTDYSRPALERLRERVDAVLVATRLAPVIDQVASGQPAEFGSLTVSREAITWKAGQASMAWRDMSGVQLDRHRVGLGRGRGRSQSIDLDGVPDSLVALLLIQDLAGRYQVKQTGKRLELPPAPPGDELVALARALLLTEMDVSEILGQPVTQSPESLARMRFFRASGIHLTVMYLGTGRIAQFNQSSGRRSGREVTGAGDRAWLANGDRTIVVTAGAATAKLTLSGLPPEQRAGVLIPLGAMVAERLAAAGLGPPSEPGAGRRAG
jgi:hypothetical protein